jgi:hypothetical protein
MRKIVIFGSFQQFLSLFEKEKTLKIFFDFGLVFFIFVMADVSARSG